MSVRLSYAAAPECLRNLVLVVRYWRDRIRKVFSSNLCYGSMARSRRFPGLKKRHVVSEHRRRCLTSKGSFRRISTTRFECRYILEDLNPTNHPPSIYGTPPRLCPKKKCLRMAFIGAHCEKVYCAVSSSSSCTLIVASSA